MKDNILNIIITGVGGQGNVLASRIISNTAVREGHSVKGLETLGATQRGGHVVSKIRIGTDVYSPEIPKNEAHILLGLDPLDAILELQYVSPNALVIINTEKILPPIVKSGMQSYPEDIIGSIKKVVKELYAFNMVELAKKAGNARTLNVVAIGIFAATEKMPVAVQTFKNVINETVPKGTETVNLKAFDIGFETMKDMLKTKSGVSS